MMVIMAFDFITSRGAWQLQLANYACCYQGVHDEVHRLDSNPGKVGANFIMNVFDGAVRFSYHGIDHRKTLARDAQPGGAECLTPVG